MVQQIPNLKNYENLDQLLADMMNMSDDPLADAGTKVVISRGNPSAKLVIVGEAPGPQENIQGKPFVGKAGQLLDKILVAGGFDPEENVYIINSVFRMPPGAGGKTFRKPETAEIDYYRPYVFEIIRLIDPLVVLLTGNVACESILEQTGITRFRGKWLESDHRWIMPVFHPSYLLRNPARTPNAPKALMWKDIQEVKRKYDELLTSP